MAKKSPTRRKSRKHLLAYFDERCRVDVFDVEKEMRIIKGRTRLKGIFAAMGLYGLAFIIAYYAWSRGQINQEIFFKASWIILLPATMAGMLSWMLSFNREENHVMQRLAAAIRDIEGEDGFIWRFAPLVSWARPADYDAKQVVNCSREKQLENIEPDNYAKVVVMVHGLLQNLGDQPVSDELMQELEQNLVAH